jgi:hypothetical protein
VVEEIGKINIKLTLVMFASFIFVVLQLYGFVIFYLLINEDISSRKSWEER